MLALDWENVGMLWKSREFTFGVWKKKVEVSVAGRCCPAPCWAGATLSLAVLHTGGTHHKPLHL